MTPVRIAIVLAGAAVCLALAFAGARLNGPGFVAELGHRAEVARDAAGGHGITIGFEDEVGWLTRHPVITGGDRLDRQTRTAVAEAIDRVPGIGGVSWRDSASGAAAGSPHCQDDVEAILKSRTIRFSEASARVDPGSARLLDEVARALVPCVGSIIAVTGHTDGNGNLEANRALSLARAEAVRWELIGRGIPADGLRAAGVGSDKPLERLDARDPANRRIEFSVIQSAPVKPTPIDTPGPG
jgi:OOP family OmpA-OmpF porin